MDELGVFALRRKMNIYSMCRLTTNNHCEYLPINILHLMWKDAIKLNIFLLRVTIRESVMFADRVGN